MDNNLIPYHPVISDIKNLIAAGQNVAYNAANRAMIMTYWNIGKRIVEEEQSGAERAEYGKRLISILSDELTKEFGSNYSGRSLRYYCSVIYKGIFRWTGWKLQKYHIIKMMKSQK